MVLNISLIYISHIVYLQFISSNLYIIIVWDICFISVHNVMNDHIVKKIHDVKFNYSFYKKWSYVLWNIFLFYEMWKSNFRFIKCKTLHENIDLTKKLRDIL